MRRAFVLFMVLAFALCGCARESGGNPDDVVSKEKITITALQYEPDNQSVDFTNMPFYQALEARTNVHAEFLAVKSADWDTRLGLMFASGSYADVILRGDVDVEEYGVRQKILAPLDDYLKECMPNYYRRLSVNGAGDTIPASDGKSYFVGYLAAEGIHVDGQFFINRSWLDALGLEAPRTVEELTNVLIAFRDGDPNGNGSADEIPYVATMNDNNSGLHNAFSFWGVPLNGDYVFLDERQTVRFAPGLDGYRSCAAWLCELYREGLLDPESLTQARNLLFVKANAGEAGFLSLSQWENTSISEEIAGQYVCILPVSAEGCAAKMPKTLEVARFGAAITVTNEHIEETLRWLDAQMETETMLVSQNGDMGEGLTLNAEGRYEAMESASSSDLHLRVPMACGQFFAPADYYYDVYDMPARRARKVSDSRMYEEAGALEDTSYFELTRLSPLTGEEAARIAALKGPIERYIDEALVRMVYTGVSDADWKAFTDGFGALGVDEYVSIYQAAYDRGRGLEAGA